MGKYHKFDIPNHVSKIEILIVHTIWPIFAKFVLCNCAPSRYHSTKLILKNNARDGMEKKRLKNILI